VNDDLHTLVGAYALDALPDPERLDFERHMTRCESCTEEVRDLVEATALLGTAVAAPPPERLRTQVLTQITTVRQAPPVPPAVAEVRRLRRWPPRVTTILAAACLVAALVTGGVAIRAQQRLDEAEAANQAVAAVLSAPDAQTVSDRVGPKGRATLVSSRERGQVVFSSSGLPAVPTSKTYQLWFMSPTGIRSAGLVARADRPVVAGGIGDATRVGVTVEPAGGSRQPTAKPLAILVIA
jgi:anti-sigma factor RsiW